MLGQPLVSFAIATHNRRQVLLRTLGQIDRCGLRPGEYETLVVDNASTDGTPDAVGRDHPRVQVVRLGENRGAVARNIAMERAAGRFVVLLDDDSYPQPGSTRRMIWHFEQDARLGAAVFRVHLPDGSEECSAYPDVFIGCGTGLRRRALQQVGLLPGDFFMQAEEYDLSLRLLDAGWEVRRFDDLRVTHLKSPAARCSARTTRLDIRNNLLLVARRFPSPWVWPYTRDWLGRYYLIARQNGQVAAYLRGVAEALRSGAGLAARRPVSAAAFERFARIEETRRRLAEAQARLGFRQVLFADLGKNVLAYYLAARALGLGVVGIADDRLARPGRRYRGLRLLTSDEAVRLRFDAVIVSNLSPVHAAVRRAAWQRQSLWPVVDLFEPRPAAVHTPLLAVA
jgi:GT2 family glycosyltransferase